MLVLVLLFENIMDFVAILCYVHRNISEFIDSKASKLRIQIFHSKFPLQFKHTKLSFLLAQGWGSSPHPKSALEPGLQRLSWI